MGGFLFAQSFQCRAPTPGSAGRRSFFKYNENRGQKPPGCMCSALNERGREGRQIFMKPETPTKDSLCVCECAYYYTSFSIFRNLGTE